MTFSRFTFPIKGLLNAKCIKVTQAMNAAIFRFFFYFST
ncbi:pheST operon leader peptide PheM [Escherichia coli]|nr:pheST operon leader peptide PheM [Escherichia coli]